MGDTDFPAVMANGGSREGAYNLASQWKRRSSGSSSSFRSGLGLPTTGEHTTTLNTIIVPYGTVPRFLSVHMRITTMA